MRKGEQTRARLVATAADLIQRQGFAATGLKQIVAESGAPRGSLYFHFPGGKEELACDALGEAARRWRAELQAVMVAPSAGEAVLRACRGLAHRLSGSSYALGSPLATTTLEQAATSDAIRAVCAEHFGRWEAFLMDLMTRDGIGLIEAARWARFALASVEGSLILCRAYGSPAPLLDAGELLRDLIDSLPHSLRG